TIIIDRADRFGLAQLHQLRGRVGRSHHQAYAYLMIPDEDNISADAKKRLNAIMSSENLGAGFNLASHDLEIRGAGELLGDEQSGHIQSIGFGLYMELLERAVKALKSGEKTELLLSLSQSLAINLSVSTIIPEDYIADVHTRLILYKRIANAENEDTLDELQIEMIDRFGILPQPVKILFQVTTLKLQAQPLGIKKIEVNDKHGRIEFIENPNINVDKLLKLVNDDPQHYQFAGSSILRFQSQMTETDMRLSKVKALLQQLS
ncbi:MAG: TRCF domain-containing protein, partial [Gammaproteobacteria bacterium]